VPRPGAEVYRWLTGEVSSHLVNAFEAMTGAAPEVESFVQAEAPTDAGLYWQQPFSGIAGTAWLYASDAAWTAAGSEVLRGAGIEDGDEATIRSTYLETTGQVLSGLGQSLTGRLGREITPRGGAEVAAASAASNPGFQNCVWVGLRLHFNSGEAVVAVGFDPEFADASEPPPPTAVLVSPAGQPAGAPSGDASPASAHATSKTFDLLLDVELPVSVSFGRAQVPLKDVLKLTTGSIVELNRSITEPVEVIVNNCVIARGEVVVVEGYYGVRIQQVISRQERLYTLS